MQVNTGNGKSLRFIKLLFAAAVFAAVFLFALTVKTQAEQLTPSFESTDNSNGEKVLDNSNYTSEPFEAGTVITLKAEQIGYVYIKWDKIPAEWTLTAGEKDIKCGGQGILHELVTLPSPVNSVSIKIPEGGAAITDLYIYSPGDLPDGVQTWLPPCEAADVLFLSTHADDEVLFFGGVIPTYVNKGDVAIQVAYFTEHYSTGENMRMHEALDGLWAMGVTHHPQFGEFKDLYSESLEEAEQQYDHEEGLGYVVRTIRRFKPQILIGHDLNGEYGHGCHRLTAKLITEAIEITDDASKYPESAKTYGTCKVPKTYLHLYPERAIELNAREPLEKFGGKTALDVAKEAYLKHDSQQWCWFYVSDGYDEAGSPNGYEYSCTKYGLFGTLVGEDKVTNDILDNITVYSKQVKKDSDAATVEYETNEKGETVTDKDGQPVTVAPAEPVTDEKGEVVTGEDGQPVTKEKASSDTKEDERNKTGSGNAGKTILIIVIIVIVIAAAWLAFAAYMKRKRRRERLARKRRAAAGSGNRPSVTQTGSRSGQRPPHAAAGRGSGRSTGSQGTRRR